MPVIPTKKQKEIFEKLKQYLHEKGYEYLGWNGENDDSHRFGIPKTNLTIQKTHCYVQFISVRATKRPKGSVGVTVSLNERNENVKEFLSGNGFFGQDKHVFVAPIDYAFRLIDTI